MKALEFYFFACLLAYYDCVHVIFGVLVVVVNIFVGGGICTCCPGVLIVLLCVEARGVLT